MSKFFFISSIGISSIGPVIPTPALLINTSILSTFLSKFLTHLFIDVVSATSNSRSGNLESVYFFGNRLVPYTSKPFSTKKSPIDLPIPDEPPVIKIVLRITKFEYKYRKILQKCTKKGKLPTSHRYDHLPLLRSRPGGFNRSWLCRTCLVQIYNV